jgi:putative ABC transport system ATP-binding protein
MSSVQPIILSAQSVSKSFSDSTGTVQVLIEASLDVQAGQSVALVGASGSGKSTLLALLAGLDVPTLGTVSLLGQPLASLNEEARAAVRRGRVGFVFQNFQLIPHLTALENVLLPIELSSPELSYSQQQATAQQWLDAVGLAAQSRQRAAVLSGGEQQRVAMARAFATDPQLIFADEPTGSLDHATGKRIEALMFEQVRAKGTALVLVTHDTALAAQCDVVVRIAGGRLTRDV